MVNLRIKIASHKNIKRKTNESDMFLMWSGKGLQLALWIPTRAILRTSVSRQRILNLACSVIQSTAADRANEKCKLKHIKQILAHAASSQSFSKNAASYNCLWYPAHLQFIYINKNITGIKTNLLYQIFDQVPLVPDNRNICQPWT